MADQNNQNRSKKLKIGIMIRDFQKLANWEYRILKGILEHPHLELSLLIKDGRNRGQGNLYARGALTNAMFSLQMKIESLVFKRKKTVNASEVIAKIKDTETIKLEPVKEGACDVFSNEDSSKVKTYGLDLILKHEFAFIKGDILESARYGIWNLCYGNKAAGSAASNAAACNIGANDGRNIAGFWEILRNEPYCVVSLEKLCPETEGRELIDRAWYNWFFSFLKTNNDLLENSVTLLFRNINKLLDGRFTITKEDPAAGGKPASDDKPRRGKTGRGKPCRAACKAPHLKDLCVYMVKFYLKAFSYILSWILPLKRMNCWALCFGKGNFLDADLSKINPVIPSKGEFWADPFLYKHNGELFVFFETYPYKTKKGKLSAGKVIDRGNGKYAVTDTVDILECPYHLSYPQIINEDGTLYMMPEAHQNKRLEVYRNVRFPDKWELYATAFAGEEIVDPTYFCDANGERWLFVNKGWTHEAELHIYKIDNLKLENIQPHRQNPVLIDCMRGRNGGGIFMYKNEYLKPGQINTHGFYGKGLQISKIKKLSLEEFEDESFITVEPKFLKGAIGMHHLYHFGENFVFDARFKRL